MRIPKPVLAAIAAVVPLALAAPAAASTTVKPAYPGTAADGAYVVSETQVSHRVLDVTIYSPAVSADTTVRLLLPPGWSPSASRTWPVLYLLHGCCDTYQTWSADTNVEAKTKGAPVIIAMPDGGPVGFYTNWWNFGLGGENWETYTATELPQILQSGFHASTRAAIGGVSTGGGAALIIAAHNPGAYSAAAAYSGMDCNLLPNAIALILATVARAGILPDDLWGDPVAQLANWEDHDPCSLAPSLQGTKLFLSVGSGVTVSGGNTSCPPGGNILESAVAPSVYAFAARLTTLGIAYTKDFYNGGCHAWPWWSRAFDKSWPMLESALGA
jgi:S-formylglutathione hydrolase FrmB